MKKKHCDCVNYESVDVVKGICLLDETFVPIDADACPRLRKKPKCKFCQNYRQEEKESLGRCVGLDDGARWISGDMIAVTCGAYTEAEHG